IFAFNFVHGIGVDASKFNLTWTISQGSTIPTPNAGTDWFYLNSITGYCSGLTWENGWFYDPTNQLTAQTSIAQVTFGPPLNSTAGVCDATAWNISGNPFSTYGDPSDNWGFASSDGQNFSAPFQFDFCPTGGSGYIDTIHFYITTDGLSGGGYVPLRSCIDSFSYPIYIKNNISITPDPAEVCEIDSLQLDGGPLDVGDYLWTGDAGQVIVGATTRFPTIVDPGTYTVRKGDASCYFEDSLVVTGVTTIITALDPLPDQCVNDLDFTLPTRSANMPPVIGTWSGIGVSNDSIFDPTVGTQILIFTPDPGQCAPPEMATITVFDTAIVNIDSTICLGDSMTVGDTMYATPGMYTRVINTVNGCDSTVNLNLMVDDYQRSRIDTVLCPGESITVNGFVYNSTISTIDTFPAPSGCDSIVTIDIIAEDYQRRDIDTSLCPGESITVNGITYTTDTNLSDTFPAPLGCDSLVNIMITALDYQRRMVDTSLCPGESITINGVVYTTDSIRG
ncbi:MAG: hypothetical protein AAGK97_12570, partial [Bacteroidota bacterium]